MIKGPIVADEIIRLGVMGGEVDKKNGENALHKRGH